MQIRPATSDDLSALRDLHLANWREAYRDLLPDAVLEGEAARHLEARWGADALEAGTVLLACDGSGRIAGFVACRDDADGGLFVDNLHVAAPARGRGIARELMGAVARRAGDRPVRLCVLDGNLGARAVYRRWAGAEGPPFDAPFLGLTLRDRRVHWPSGHALAQALAAGASP